MKEELNSIIENELNNLEINQSDITNEIKELVEKQNDNQKKEIETRKKIFEIFEKLKKMNINIEYNDSMTTEELEKLLEGVQI